MTAVMVETVVTVEIAVTVHCGLRQHVVTGSREDSILGGRVETAVTVDLRQ